MSQTELPMSWRQVEGPEPSTAAEAEQGDEYRALKHSLKAHESHGRLFESCVRPSWEGTEREPDSPVTRT